MNENSSGTSWTAWAFTLLAAFGIPIAGAAGRAVGRWLVRVAGHQLDRLTKKHHKRKKVPVRALETKKDGD